MCSCYCMFFEIYLIVFSHLLVDGSCSNELLFFSWRVSFKRILNYTFLVFFKDFNNLMPNYIRYN